MKYCIDCQHVRSLIPLSKNEANFYCSLAPGPVSLVTGRPEYYVPAITARSRNGSCGPEARQFLPK